LVTTWAFSAWAHAAEVLSDKASNTISFLINNLLNNLEKQK
jgi:hypothetical protein